MGITPKQQKVYSYIIHFQQDHGYCPSQREIADHFGFKSLGTVQNYLKRLESNQLLKKSWNSKRGLEILSPPKPPTPQAEELYKVPLLGKVAAGLPIEYQVEEEIEVPKSYLHSKPSEVFALEVEGDSMIGEGILSGDIVFIRKQEHAKNGDTVVANINGEATIKKFYKKQSHIELVSANEKYAPIIVKMNSGAFKIEGILESLFRKF